MLTVGADELIEVVGSSLTTWDAAQRLLLLTGALGKG